MNDLTGHLALKAQGGASITTDGDSIITINAGAGTVGEINNTNNTLDITNPNGPITTINVKDDGINTTQLADGAVTTPKLAADAVTGAKIADGTVSAADIGPDIVSSIDGVSNDGGNIDLEAGANIAIISKRSESDETAIVAPKCKRIYVVATISPRGSDAE